MGDVLVDSNVLLRSVQPAHPHYPLASAAIASLLRQDLDLCVARQNLVEFWVVATRPLASNGLAMNPAIVASELRSLRIVFSLLEGIPGTADVWERLVGQHLVLGKQAHDASLVATMMVHGVRRLLTFNGEDFKRYEPSIEIIAPASVTPTV